LRIVIKVSPAHVSNSLRSLFSHTAPAGLRCFAVLAGDNRGRIWTDDLANPTWGIVQESAFGTLYLEGTFPKGLLAAFVEERQRDGEVLYGFWAEDDALQPELPPPAYNGFVWESDQRTPTIDLTGYLQQVPLDCSMRAIDPDLFPRIQDSTFYADMFGSSERALERGFGYCLIRGDEILCEAFAGTSHRGVIEIGVNTWEDHRQRGYATLTCAHVIHEAERRGYRTYWNCAVQNLASTTLARRLGFALRKYRLLGWF
jgi:GNAT superfamily N-acetyltransferase